MKIIFSRSCLGYSMPGHPESPERVMDSYGFLKGKHEFVEPSPATEKHVLLAHTRTLLDSVKNGMLQDPDTPAYQDIYDHALLSAGSAIRAMKLSMDGESAFSLMRPPGHHAGRDFLGGFCYFNNIAIAVKAAQEYHGIGRVLIVDIDCHHGNGTQDIFLGDSKVMYISLHQSPLYPGIGKHSEKNCLNYPLPIGTTGGEYLKVLSIALEKASVFSPELIGVSSGFDAYKYDPITNMGLDLGTYRKIGELIAGLGAPTFSVLEGGYSKDLPLCIGGFLVGMEGKT